MDAKIKNYFDTYETTTKVEDNALIEANEFFLRD